jgi:hypothetical protein
MSGGEMLCKSQPNKKKRVVDAIPKIEDFKVETLKVASKQPSAVRITEEKTSSGIRPKR